MPNEQGSKSYGTVVGILHVGTGGYDGGVEMAQTTTADYINYGLEHRVYDITRLRDFMRSLVVRGATKSGHRTPAVIITPPVYGTDAASLASIPVEAQDSAPNAR